MVAPNLTRGPPALVFPLRICEMCHPLPPTVPGVVPSSSSVDPCHGLDPLFSSTDYTLFLPTPLQAVPCKYIPKMLVLSPPCFSVSF